MRIGVYLQTWHVGGMAVFSERLANGLHASGHNVCLILATPYGKRDSAGKDALHRLVAASPFPVHCLHLNAFHPKERAGRAAQHIVALACDALLLSGHRALRQALPLLKTQAALVAIAHTDDEDSYAEFAGAEPHCHAYVGVSRVITHTLERLRPEHSHLQVFHARTGVPPMPGNPSPSCPEARILVVCRLVQRQKQVLELPALWHEFKASGGNARLTVCGSGEEETRLRQEFAGDIRAGRVVFTGAVARERLGELYAQHDIFLSVSAYEGLPLAVMEAATAGLYPLLSKTRSGHAELVEVLGLGRLCPVGDPAGFASALIELTSHPEKLRGARQQVRQRALAEFGLQPMINAYAAIAAEAVRSRIARAASSPEPIRSVPGLRVDFLRRFVRRWQYCRHYGWRIEPGARL